MTGDLERFLLVRARARSCALPLARVLETMRPLAIERVPGAPRFVLGLSLIRGAPTPVVDLGAVLGDESARATTRLVTVRAGERSVALAVESVDGVRSLARAAFSELPALARPDAEGPLAAVAALDRELVLLLASARLVPEETWRLLSAAREGS